MKKMSVIFALISVYCDSDTAENLSHLTGKYEFPHIYDVKDCRITTINGKLRHKLYFDGDQFWYYNKQLHRDNGPAIIYADGHKEWWQEGKLHRANGPAVIHANGNQFWYQNGIINRKNGPASIYTDCQVWYNNGQIHRQDGPAIEFNSGFKIWYKNGIKIEN